MSTHIPVLINEVVEHMAPRDGAIYVDGTFGGGGYSSAVLNAANCKVFGIDRDPDALVRAKPLEEQFKGRLKVLHGCFGDMVALLAAQGIDKVDGVMLDIGVSSYQIDEASRGFSFRENGPLDMRMAQDGPSAADLVNELDEKSLADIIWRYGEERQSRRIARAIVTKRAEEPFRTTGQLASLVRANVRASKDGIDPATRTFQGLRIAVNDELGELERGLIGAEQLLAPQGRLVVVSFHSLEDRIAKTFLRERSTSAPRGSRYMPESGSGPKPSLELLARKAIRPTDEECRENPRARSSRLRSAIRTDAPAWKTEGGR